MLKISSANIFILGVIFLQIFITHGADFITKKPDWIKTCRINDPDYFDCSKESVQILMNHVIKGDIPEINAKLGSLDPIKLDKIVFKQDNNEAVKLAAEIDDLVIKGLLGLKITESKVFKKDYSWHTRIFLPKINMNGKYKMDGRVLLLPLNGNGKVILDIDNLKVLMRTKTHLYKKGDFIFSNITKVRVDLDPGHVHGSFDNLFNGSNKEVEKSTNELFNQNWREFFEALRPLITDTIERMLLKILKESFDILPTSFLIEDIIDPDELYRNKKSS